ncbi:DUF2497 domain-containing protein [Aestuariivirga sp.]|uniref:DUF2497 domain-containing protein n=1 Tax=Aestuariivirga sp. TaxID=2650926 RepID=UPI00391DBD68
MEDLLASIRKAIHEDIGDVRSAMPMRSASAPAPAPPPRTAAEDLSAAASEIQQLREKITRSRSAGSAQLREPAPRPAEPAADILADPPRRSWRDADPHNASPPQARLRAALIDHEPPRPMARPAAEPQRQRVEPQTREAGQREVDARDESFDEPRMREPYRPPGAAPAGGPSILSGDSAIAVQSAFGRLADTVLARAAGERSIEDMTRDLLRGMLKQWLDENLPPLVERLVREEIERVARSGR